MKKIPLLALAAAAFVAAGFTPALAGDHVGFSFGVIVNDHGRGYYDDDDGWRRHRYYEHERWERERHCDRDRYRTYYERPYYDDRRVLVVRPYDDDDDHRGWHRY